MQGALQVRQAPRHHVQHLGDHGDVAGAGIANQLGTPGLVLDFEQVHPTHGHLERAHSLRGHLSPNDDTGATEAGIPAPG